MTFCYSRLEPTNQRLMRWQLPLLQTRTGYKVSERAVHLPDAPKGFVYREELYPLRNNRHGVWRKYWAYVGTYRFTALRVCRDCGLRSTPKRIQNRREVFPLEIERLLYNPDWFEYREDSYDLCMACYNKRKPLLKAAEDARENKRLIYRIQKEISNVRKDQNHRPTT